jgi:hypothetical protein
MVHLLGLLRRFRGVASVVLALPAIVFAQDDDISIAIAKHAELTSDGSVIVQGHDPEVVGADVEPAQVVGEDGQDVGSFLVLVAMGNSL